MKNKRQSTEKIMQRFFFCVAGASIAILILIMLFLFLEGLPVFNVVSVKNFIFGEYWYPTSDPADFGIFPLIVASLSVTALSSMIAIPLGVMTAIYLAELASSRVAEFVKSMVELLAALPSVVLGFFGMVVVAPFLQNVFGIPTGLNLFNSAMINGIALSVILFFMLKNGLSAISWDFLTEMPRDSMTKGGILPCIVGTALLGLGAIVIALPVGVASAIYLNEYAKPGVILRAIRLGINNLAGIPSVVFGLFGLAFFVTYLKMGVSLLAGCLTLAAMSLPVIIGSTEEALKSVPDTYREASLGLGATK